MHVILRLVIRNLGYYCVSGYPLVHYARSDRSSGGRMWSKLPRGLLDCLKSTNPVGTLASGPYSKSFLHDDAKFDTSAGSLDLHCMYSSRIAIFSTMHAPRLALSKPGRLLRNIYRQKHLQSQCTSPTISCLMITWKDSNALSLSSRVTLYET